MLTSFLILNLENSADNINLPYFVVFPDFVNLHNPVIYLNLTNLSDFTGHFYSIRGFNLIKGFDRIMNLISWEGNPISQDIWKTSEFSYNVSLASCHK